MMGRFIEELKHAFAVTPVALPEGEPLPGGLERFAVEVVRRGLEMPAVMFLESVKPLGFLAGQSLHALRPLASAFLDESQVAEVATALEDKRTVRRLIERIEILASDRG